MNFWQKLKKEKVALGTTRRKGGVEPLMVLAPMADVTDPAMRRVIAKYGKPDVMWTEFVSADGLFLGGYEHLIKDLAFTEAERPIVAQFFTSRPDMMKKAAELACDLGFDGVDINMGCPDKSVEKQGGGAALIKNPKLAQEIIFSAMEGAKKDGKNLPVSIKTRIGYNKNELETWLPALLETHPAVITIHARTRKEMSLVPARWEHVARAVEIRNDYFNNLQKNIPEDERTLIFGNGDVFNIDDAKAKAKESGADGVMLGRAIFGNPFLFSKEVSRTVLDIPTRLRVLVEHTKLFSELLPHKSFAIMKKHFKAYVTGFDGAKELRMKLMEAESADKVGEIIEDYIKNGLK